ncbi:MAG: site-specific DNA-methyltransferase, partial [Methylobacter sp.]
APDLLQTNLDLLTETELRNLLTQYMTQQKLGLYWERNQIEHDKALNNDSVFLAMADEHGKTLSVGDAPYRNLIIEGDNFDALRCLRATHTNKIGVIYIDPPYNTGNKDWVYNDRYVNKDDRYKASMWLEFIYRRLMLARDLLAPDGCVLVSINDENRAKLELLMDKVFQGMRIGSFVWRSRTGGNDTKGAFLSTNHEHVLVYGREKFRFSGDEKSYSIYKHEEAGRLFYLSDLTKAHDLKERPNTYYTIHDPVNDVWYPCNPNRVWAYASKHKVKQEQKLRGNTIEDLIEQGQVWFPPDQRIACFDSEDELLSAIDAQDIPFSGSTPLLTRDTPNLHEWIGRKIGYGRPRLKKFKDGLKNENQPISSWLTPRQEEDTADETLNMPIVGTTEEGSRVLKEIMGNKAFPYPKPLSLINVLLAQASKPDDIILDFFAGSGTTAQAILQLNQEDQGNRRFILVSNSEAPPNDTENKNLCRDVCAVRVKRVIEGYKNRQATGGNFAYCRMEKISPADVIQDLHESLIWNSLCLKYRGELLDYSKNKLNTIYQDEETAIIFCPHLDDEAVAGLLALAVGRIILYSDRPNTAAELLAPYKNIQSESSLEAVLQQQGGSHAV